MSLLEKIEILEAGHVLQLERLEKLEENFKNGECFDDMKIKMRGLDSMLHSVSKNYGMRLCEVESRINNMIINHKDIRADKDELKSRLNNMDINND